MICSKCGANMPDDNKFCERCGNKLEKQQETKAAVQMIKPSAVQSEAGSVCQGCGAPLNPGDKFCMKCGMKQEPQPVQQKAPAVPPAPGQTPPAPGPTPPAPRQTQPAPGQTPPVSGQTPPAPGQTSSAISQPSKTVQKKKSAGKVGPIIFIIILLLLIIALAGGYFYFVAIRGENPIEIVKEMLFSDDDSDDKDDQDDTEDDKDNFGGQYEGGEPEDVKGDVTLLEPAEELVKQADTQYENGSYTDGAIPTAREAIELYMTVAEENHLEEEAQEGIEDAFLVYSNALIRYCDIIKQQGAYVECFNEVNNWLTDSVKFIAEITEKGYSVDSQAIEAYKDNLIPEFRDKFIEGINSITNYENWSRDEAWSYAERAYAVKKNGKPLLFNDADLEDPLRMRYVYCLAWITRKRCETGLADGSMSYGDAVNSMVAILEETDYNPLLLQDIITYGSAAGLDVSKYRNAYNSIVEEIKNEQGLTIDTDIIINSMNNVNLNHFWYFNDLDGEDKYMVDSHNGTTAATREWIRNNVPVILGE